jgi:hypothetical protein
MSVTPKLVEVKVRINPSLKRRLKELAKAQRWSVNKSVENAIECAVLREITDKAVQGKRTHGFCDPIYEEIEQGKAKP